MKKIVIILILTFVNHLHISAQDPVIIPVAFHFSNSFDVSDSLCIIEACKAQVKQLNLDFSACNYNAGDLCSWIDAGCDAFGGDSGPNAIPVNGSMIQFCLTDQNLPPDEDNIGGYGITIGENYDNELNAPIPWLGCYNFHISNATFTGAAYLGMGAYPDSIWLNGTDLNPIVMGGEDFDGCMAGSIGIGTNSQYNKGSIATHETGHYFGLLHTWEDNLGDTPQQEFYNLGEVTVDTVTCTSTASFGFSGNFMDYPDDEFTSNFTAQQVALMQSVVADQAEWATDKISCWQDWQDGTITYNACVQGPCGNVVSTSDPNLESTIIQIHPNPATDHVRIIMPETEIEKVEIYSSTGKKVNSFSQLGINPLIQLNNIESGLYFIQTTTLRGELHINKISIH